MALFPHREKLDAALTNPKCAADLDILNEAKTAYQTWVRNMDSLQTTGAEYLSDLVRLLNEYKDFLEVELIARRGSDFIKRQKGQLKLDNSVLEEFLPHLVTPKLLNNLPTAYQIETGSQTSFMSLAFCPQDIRSMQKPKVIIKDKDQDFTLGKTVYYKFSSEPEFQDRTTTDGKLFLSVLAAECKVNYDKTMFQECAGTAARLKQGCPIAKYYALVEYLDMIPEDTRLTNIDNVYLLRKAHRLPPTKRDVYAEVRAQHHDKPISVQVVSDFLSQIQNFIDATWYNPDEALERGSFV